MANARHLGFCRLIDSFDFSPSWSNVESSLGLRNPLKIDKVDECHVRRAVGCGTDETVS